MRDEQDDRLTEATRGESIERREFLARAAALGLSIPAAEAILAPGATAGGRTAKAGGTLRFARNFEPQSLDPFGPADNGSIFVRVQIWDTLVEARPGVATVAPALAESWHSSPDGKTWMFRLRRARFSNGEPVTAEDVKFTLDRFMNPKLNVNIPSLAFGMKRVEIVDPRTVRIHLAFPVGAFLINVSVFPASIISKKQFLKLGKK